MSPTPLQLRDDLVSHTDVDADPLAGRVSSLVVELLSLCIISHLLSKRVCAITHWREVSYLIWLVLAIYTFSIVFVITAIILHYGVGTNGDNAICTAAVFLCLSVYMFTKILIYFFLIDRAHIIRSVNKPRLRSKLYLFNVGSTIVVYSTIAVFDFLFHTSYQEKGQCRLGVALSGLIPTITFDALTNIYLTILFLKPLLNTYSIRRVSPKPGSASSIAFSIASSTVNPELKPLAIRTMIGCVLTLIGSLINLILIWGLNNEPAWLCLFMCTSDVSFSALVIHWVT